MRLAKGEGSVRRLGGRRPSSRPWSKLVADGAISGTNAKEVFAEHFASGATVASIVETRGFRQISDAGALGTAVEEVLAANPAAVADYRAGKAAAAGFLVGQVMKATRGQANAAMVQAALRERLDKVRGRGREPEGGDGPAQPGVLGDRRRSSSRRLPAGARPVGALPGAQGPGSEHLPLRGLARHPPPRRRPQRRLDHGRGAAAPAQLWGLVAVVGFVLVFVGFAVR